MRAWIARMTEDNIDQSAIEKAGEILKNGGLAAFPAETVYVLAEMRWMPKLLRKFVRQRAVRRTTR